LISQKGSEEKATKTGNVDSALLLDPLDTVSVNLDDVYKSLTVLSTEVVAKLNEILKEKLPEGIESLKAEELTPEATAQRIVQSLTAIFSAFESESSDLGTSAKISEFFKLAREGIAKGLSQAKGILKDLGAFEFEGVENSIKETELLIDKKLSMFETKITAESNKDVEVTTDAELVKDESAETL